MEDQKEKIMVGSVRELNVYRMSFETAMEIYELSKNFPKEERFSLIDQIRRSSRSIPANIREGYAKRRYENVFIRHLNDAVGSCEETRTWLEFARDCEYIKLEEFENLDSSYDELSAMIYSLMKNWRNIEDKVEVR